MLHLSQHNFHMDVDKALSVYCDLCDSSGFVIIHCKSGVHHTGLVPLVFKMKLLQNSAIFFKSNFSTDTGLIDPFTLQIFPSLHTLQVKTNNTRKWKNLKISKPDGNRIMLFTCSIQSS